VSIELPRVEGVTLLPLPAVKEHKGRSAVWVVDPAAQVVRTRFEVEVAGPQGNDVIIRSGLKPGDVVVTAGVHVLTEGQKVRVLTAGTPVAAAASQRQPAAAALRSPWWTIT
jgi:multidrug efflux system membrane fusion protein